MTEIWWCRVYDRPELEADCSFKGVPLQGHKACGLVRLVPVDALVIVRDADGNWPIWFRAFVKSWWIKSQRSDYEGRWPREFMDALAKAVEDNPQ